MNFASLGICFESLTNHERELSVLIPTNPNESQPKECGATVYLSPVRNVFITYDNCYDCDDFLLVVLTGGGKGKKQGLEWRGLSISS